MPHHSKLPGANSRPGNWCVGIPPFLRVINHVVHLSLRIIIYVVFPTRTLSFSLGITTLVIHLSLLAILVYHVSLLELPSLYFIFLYHSCHPYISSFPTRINILVFHLSLLDLPSLYFSFLYWIRSCHCCVSSFSTRVTILVVRLS